MVQKSDWVSCLKPRRFPSPMMTSASSCDAISTAVVQEFKKFKNLLVNAPEWQWNAMIRTSDKPRHLTECSSQFWNRSVFFGSLLLHHLCFPRSRKFAVHQLKKLMEPHAADWVPPSSLWLKSFFVWVVLVAQSTTESGGLKSPSPTICICSQISDEFNA